MTKPETSAAGLFKQFLPKYKAIKLVPHGFFLGAENAWFCFGHDTEEGFTYYDNDHSGINIKTAKLAFTFTYDPASKVDPTAQMLYACWNAILAGPFAGRTFYAEPEPEKVDEYFQTLAEGRCSMSLPIMFSHSGEKIPGLAFAERMSTDHWSYFVPDKSPEGKAIAAAVAFEQGQRRAQQRQAEQNTPPTVDALQARLNQALAAVPA